MTGCIEVRQYLSATATLDPGMIDGAPTESDTEFTMTQPSNLPQLFGPYGSSALPYTSRFKHFGANAFWFHGFDPQAFEACQQHGLAACVEFKTFRADFEAHPELVPIGIDGRPIRYGELVQGVCLSQTEFLQETEANLLAGLQAYQPTGIWLDYLTYAGWFETPNPDLQESCFCPACIADFCQSTGIDADRPSTILGQHQAAWTRHKCERIADFAAHYAGLIRAQLPDCVVGAYMCPWQPHEFEGALARIFAQDYSLMAPAVDIFTPLIYVRKSGREMDWGREFLEATPTFVPENRPVMLILDALDFPASLQAVAESRVPSHGLQMFNGAQVFQDPDRAKIFQQAVDAITAR